MQDGTLRRLEVELKRRTEDCESHMIADEGHFFMLSAEEETKRYLKRWGG